MFGSRPVKCQLCLDENKACVPPSGPLKARAIRLASALRKNNGSLPTTTTFEAQAAVRKVLRAKTRAKKQVTMQSSAQPTAAQPSAAPVDPVIERQERKLAAAERHAKAAERTAKALEDLLDCFRKVHREVLEEEEPSDDESSATRDTNSEDN
ncbi:hypothetical protein MGN70_010240 [Eutypa lata]|nr:hypothetical protein MGN70_010240 [Eutypa lata]